MSEATLSQLRYRIETESKILQEAESELENLDRSIGNAMDDRVGHSARESLGRIRESFSVGFRDCIEHAECAADALQKGYIETESLSARGNMIVSKARSVLDRLGEI